MLSEGDGRVNLMDVDFIAEKKCGPGPWRRCVTLHLLVEAATAAHDGSLVAKHHNVSACRWFSSGQLSGPPPCLASIGAGR